MSDLSLGRAPPESSLTTTKPLEAIATLPPGDDVIAAELPIEVAVELAGEPKPAPIRKPLSPRRRRRHAPRGAHDVHGHA